MSQINCSAPPESFSEPAPAAAADSAYPSIYVAPAASGSSSTPTPTVLQPQRPSGATQKGTANRVKKSSGVAIKEEPGIKSVSYNKYPMIHFCWFLTIIAFRITGFLFVVLPVNLTVH